MDGAGEVAPTISVIVCAYADERWGDLVAAVESVRREAPLEIIVVVDHNERLLERARAHLAGVIVIDNTLPRGLSGARNCGLATARGTVIAFVDDDAVVAPGWLSRLVLGFRDPRVLGVGGPVVPLWASGRPRWFPEEFDWVVGCTFRGMPEEVGPVRALIGANMSFRREMFEAIGGFHGAIGRVGARPLAGEETELCIRARQRWPGGLWLYRPDVRVYHRVPDRRARFRYFRARSYAEGLSKARISRLVGVADGTAAERAYASRTLPRGVIRHLRASVRGRDPHGLARAAAIIAGLTFTAAGYVAGALADTHPLHRTNGGMQGASRPAARA